MSAREYRELTMLRHYGLPRRCGLCRFELSNGENVIAVKRDGRVSAPLPYHVDMDLFKCQYGLPEGQAMPRPPVHGPTQRRNVWLVTICHVECSSLVPHESFRSLLAAIAYSHEPPVAESARRTRWLQKRLAAIIDVAVPWLPLDICFEIASHCLREFAVRTAQARWLGSNKSLSYARLTDSLYATYAYFEGVRYITSLSNDPPAGDHELVHTPELERPVKTLYFADDHLGLRRVVCACDGDAAPVSHDAGVWWTAHSVHDPGEVLSARKDDIKLRNFVNPPRPARGMGIVAQGGLNHSWPWPMHPSRRVRIKVFSDLYEPKRRLGLGQPARMASVPLRSEATTGLSITWNRSMGTMHAHGHGSDLDFYRSASDSTVWLYMPLDEDESILDMFATRCLKYGSAGLAFTTNKERVAVLAPHPPEDRHWVDVIDRAGEDDGHEVYFDVAQSGFPVFAFEAPDPRPGPGFTTPTPASPRPIRRFDQDFFHSSAKLDGVVEMTPCRGWTRETPTIAGLLLRFPGGHRECLGQMRLDRLGDPVDVSEKKEMWLEFRKTKRGPWLARMEFLPPRETGPEEEVSWLHVPLEGRLEWWFSARHCWLDHEGYSSPELRESW